VHGFFILEDASTGTSAVRGARTSRRCETLAPAHVIYRRLAVQDGQPGPAAAGCGASGPVLDRIVTEKRRDDCARRDVTQHAAADWLDAGLYRPARARARALPLRAPRRPCLWALDAELGEELAEGPAGGGGGNVWVTLRHALDDGQLYREALAAGVTFVPGTAMLDRAPPRHPPPPSYGLADPDLIREACAGSRARSRPLHAATPQRRSVPVT